MIRLLLLNFPKIKVRLKNLSEATDFKGRRYGEYFWVSVDCGHISYILYPKHCRGWFKSWFWVNKVNPKQMGFKK